LGVASTEELNAVQNGRFSPFTIAGFALAGGDTNFSVANSGTPDMTLSFISLLLLPKDEAANVKERIATNLNRASMRIQSRMQAGEVRAK
jgi:hypothetical protein